MSLCHDIVSLSKINMFLKGNKTNMDKLLKQNRKRSNAPVATGIAAAGEDAAFCKGGREAAAWWLGNSRMKTAPLLSSQIFKELQSVSFFIFKFFNLILMWS